MPTKAAKKSKRKAPPQKPAIQNRRARFDYELGDSLTVGLALTGPEVKSLRLGHGQLRGAYVTVKDNELYLIGATVNGTHGIPLSEQDKGRTRKLLAKRREIDALITAKQQGRTIVPLELLTATRFIKLRIAVGKGKRKYDKRATLKERDAQRDVNRAVRAR